MKHFILIILIIILSSRVLISQEPSDTIEKGKRISLGVRAGLYLSEFSGEGGETHGVRSSLTITNEVQYKPGFSLGVFIDIKAKNRFSIQPELNLIFYSHRVKYNEEYGLGTLTQTDGDYILSGSMFQICLLPKLAFGKNSNVEIFAGPFCRIPFSSMWKGQITTTNSTMVTYNPVSYNINYTKNLDPGSIGGTVKGGVGLITGLRADIPVKSSFFFVEFRIGGDIGNSVSYPGLTESSFTLGLSYLIK